MDLRNVLYNFFSFLLISGLVPELIWVFFFANVLDSTEWSVWVNAPELRNDFEQSLLTNFEVINFGLKTEVEFMPRFADI